MEVGIWPIRVHTTPIIPTLAWFGLDRAGHENTPSTIVMHAQRTVPVSCGPDPPQKNSSCATALEKIGDGQNQGKEGRL